MTGKDFLKFLKDIFKVHPEALDADIWAGKMRIRFIGLDKRHKPPRIKLGG
jgi:hypothetical protein